MKRISSYYLLLLGAFYFYLAHFFKKSLHFLIEFLGDKAGTNQLPQVTQLMFEYPQLLFLILCFITLFFSFVSFFTKYSEKKLLHIVIFILFFSVIILIVYFISSFLFSQFLIHNLQTCKIQLAK